MWAAAALLVVAGCQSGGAADSPDDPAPEGAEEDPAEIGEGEGEGELGPGSQLPSPDLPALSDWSCPEGWLSAPVGEGTDQALTACRPPPGVEGGCQGATAQFPGDSECQPLGTPCPEDGGPASDDDLRRLAGYGPDAPIQIATPASIGGVLAGLGDEPTIISLTQTTYPGRMDIPDGARVAFVGACVEGTSLSSEGQQEFALRVRPDREVVVANLQVPPGSWGVRVFGRGALTLRDVLIEGVTGGAALGTTADGELTLERVAIRDTQLFDGKAGGAIIGLSGSVTRGVDVEVDGGNFVGILIDGAAGEAPAVASFEGLAMRRIRLVETLAEAGDLFPPPLLGGVVALANSQVTLDRAHLEDCQGVGLTAAREREEGGPRGRLVARDVVIDRQTAGEQRRWGWAASARRGGEVVLERFLADSFQEAALVVSGSNRFGVGTMRLSDVVLINGRPTRPTRVGFGMALFGGSEVIGERVYIERSIGWGISVAPALPDPVVDLTDLVIRRSLDSGETGTRAGAADGGGVISEGWNQLTFTRTLIEEVSGFGMALYGSNVAARDLTIRSVAEDACGEISDEIAGGCRHADGVRYSGGTALLAAQGAGVDLDGFEFSDCELAGLQIDGGAIVTAVDGVIHDNSIGMAAPPPADPAEWFTDVYVYDNDADVTRDALPVPEPGTIFAEDDG